MSPAPCRSDMAVAAAVVHARCIQQLPQEQPACPALLATGRVTPRTRPVVAGCWVQVLTVQSGDDMPSLAREIAHHFDTQGARGGGCCAAAVTCSVSCEGRGLES